ncbi:putative type VI secretion system effector [Paraburkholderia sp. Cy-641]|uniref:putative type VI secretion system effector n=1 Tax=Paraburkholderia sp. Cy-641 TaxID=2608337 RepID=UPI001F04AADB|nr:putative type VI secretion system effector [Paraburkholderia sp. Cy-641]
MSTILLRGTLSNLERSRRSHSFVLTQVQQQHVGAAALGSSAMGMGAAGIGLLNMTANSDEEADWVQFELDGKQVQGWLWMMPMRNGDSVEVVAQQVGTDRYIAYSVKRDGDDIVAVYPHATAGRKAHYRNMTRMMLWAFCIIFPLFSLMFYFAGGGFGGDALAFFLMLGAIGIGGFLMFCVLFYRAARKLMGFVRIAETVFKTYGWPDVEVIDLRATSRANRRENTLSNFGRYYFRYK